MNTQEESQLIAFVKGELPHEQAAIIEKRCREDPSFAQTVGELRLLMEVAHRSREQDMRARVAAAAAEVDADPKPSRRPGPMLFLIAASATLLLLVGAYYMFLPPLGQRIFEREFSNLRYYGETAGGPTNSAYRAYLKEDYTTAAILLQQVPCCSPSWDSAQVYLANCQLMREEFEAATHTLERMLHTPHTDSIALEWDARWYLSLAYIRTDRMQEAQPQLQMLIKQGGAHADDAKRVLGQLEFEV